MSSNQLTSDQHHLLSEYVISLLNKNNISTILDFVNEKTQNLISYTNLTFSDVIEIRNDFIKIKSPEIFNALDHYKSFSENFKYIPTGIVNLDDLLVYGLSNQIFEFCGLSATGKSQVCNTIAVNVAQYQQLDVLYIDTKRDFSVQRLVQILINRRCSKAEIGRILKRIKIERIYDTYGLLNILNMLHKEYNNFNPFKVIIIDSLPSLFILHQGESERMGLLTELSNILKKIAIYNYAVIIVVNMITRSFNLDVQEGSKNCSNTLLNIGLGKYWKTIPAHRLLLTKIDEDNNYLENKRKIEILKSTKLKTGNWCYLHIVENGVD